MTSAFQSNAFQNNAFQIDAGPTPTGAIVGYGPGWNVIFDQDMLAKFEAERANEDERRRTISTLFDRLYGRAVEAPADAPAPSAPLAEVEHELAARTAAYQREKSRELGIQIEMLNALKDRAVEVAREKAYRRMVDEEDDDIIGMIA